ncbi:FKBP-type peptidyl-prolyl cis-trans isomerase [Porphyromonadaceae bacterium W3.11]|nr:FKBP-type peptidyl-prolyl cis-trans isomerase [Porphyromonadaceae bacterium W3.11]
MKKNILGILMLGIVLLATSCNSLSSTPDEKSEYQIKNESYIEDIAKNPDYTELKFLNHKDKTNVYYKVIKSSPNPDGQKPYQNSEVRIELSGKLISGEVIQQKETMDVTIFDINSEGQPVGIIKGLQYALQRMTSGDKWEVIIPYNLGYGSGGQGRITPYSTLIFEVELMKIKKL